MGSSNLDKLDPSAWDKWNQKSSELAKYKAWSSVKVFGEFSEKIPFVSVMVLTYKRAHGLRRALDSALAQEYGEYFEIVVVDDCPDDAATMSLMREYCAKFENIVYYKNKHNLGQYGNWNRALELCRTEWFCLLHDDDQLKKSYLTEVTKAIGCCHPEVSLLGVYFETKDERKTALGSLPEKRTVDHLVELFIRLRQGKLIQITTRDNIRHIFVFSCCLMIRRKAALDVGGLNDCFYPSADFVFCSKMAWHYKVVFLPKILCIRGISENESLREDVCKDSIRAAYNLTKAIMRSRNKSTPSNLQATFAAIVAEIGVLGYRNDNYSLLKESLGIPPVLRTRVTRMLVMMASRLLWGSLLFRRSRSVYR